MKSSAQALIDAMVEYLTTNPQTYRIRELLVLKKSLTLYKERFGNGKTYQLKRTACQIVTTEFVHRDNPNRRDCLMDL